MTMPRTRVQSAKTPADLLGIEFAQAKAEALGRLGRALEAAIAALADFDAHPSRAPSLVERPRAILVEEASLALWHFVVQREACGLRDLRQVMRDYRVPAEVAARMGAWPALVRGT